MSDAARGRAGRLLRGGAVIGGLGAARTATRALEIAALAYAWGAGALGEWLILHALPAYLAGADLGVVGAARRAMAIDEARGDRSDAAALRAAAAWTSRGAMAAVGLIGCAALFGFPALSVFGVSTIHPDAAAAILGLAALQIWLALETRVAAMGFGATLRYDREGAFVGVAGAAAPLAIAAAALLGAGPLAAAAAAAAVYLGCAVWATVAARRATPWIFAPVGVGGAWIMARRMVKPGLQGLGVQLAAALEDQGGRLAVAAALTPQAVAVYAALRMMGRALNPLTQALLRTIGPELSAAYGRSDRPTIRMLSRSLGRLSLWPTAAFCAVAILAAPILLPVWTSGEIRAPGVGVVAALVAAAAAEAVWIAAAAPLLQANRHGRAAAWAVGLCLAAPIGVYFAAVALGLLGGAAVVCAVHIALVVVMIRLGVRLGGDAPWPYLRAILTPPIAELRAGVAALRRSAPFSQARKNAVE